VLLETSLALLNSSWLIIYHACHCGRLNIWECDAPIGANHWCIGQDISNDFNYGGLREGYYNDVLTMIDHAIPSEIFRPKPLQRLRHVGRRSRQWQRPARWQGCLDRRVSPILQSLGHGRLATPHRPQSAGNGQPVPQPSRTKKSSL
jgi:hypothetical protein